MHSGDALGDEGRKALNACVKVKIYGKPEIRRYGRSTALNRLLSCYGGLFSSTNADFGWLGEYQRRLLLPTELNSFGFLLKNETYNIVDIHDALVKFDERTCVEKYPEEGPGSDELRRLIDNRRADVEREYKEAIANPDGRLRYSWLVARRRVTDCFAGIFLGGRFILVYVRENAQMKKSYNIIEIYNAFVHWDKTRKTDEKRDALQGPGSDELKKSIDEHREHLKEEYQKAKVVVPNYPYYDESSIQSLRQYSPSEAERQVRDCFADTSMWDTEIFPKEKDESDQTFDIFDIKKAIDHFDTKTFFDACKYPCEQTPTYAERRKEVDKERASIREEYEEAISNIEIEHGSGFVIHDHFIITNKHVIQTYLDETESHEISISNDAIDDRPCTVVHHDAGKDLALLYCQDLNLRQSLICPLQLSNKSVLPGMPVFAFGYPLSHTGKTALFVGGNVSGSKETLAGHSMIVLNCSLNSGNSGGPVLHWANGRLKVVGVATQKHFKEILTLEERETIENIRESLQTCRITDVPDSVKQSSKSLSEHYRNPGNRQNPLALLTLKLYDALETHSQFNLSNALPGKLVVDFVREYRGEYEKELAEMIKLASKYTDDTLQSVHTAAFNEQ